MKKTITLYFTLLLIVHVNAQQINFCEDFESFTTGNLIAQTSPSWNTWSELEIGAVAPFIDDVMINSNQSSSGSNSLYFPPTAVDGPEDIILMFDTTQNITQVTFPSLTTPYVSGNFIFSQMMYVRGGSGAYFNFQALNTLGQTNGQWALQVTFTDNGTQTGDILMDNTSGISFTAEYPVNTWFEIRFEINISNNNWELFIDGTSFGSFSNTINQIASLDLFARANDEFYIDDVCYTYTPFSALTYDMSAIDLNLFSNVILSTAPFTISGDIVNLSSNIIDSLSINYSINGATPVVDNLTSLNLSLFDTLTFNHPISWTPPDTGVYLVEIWATNLNGNIDLNTTNDVFNKNIYVWNDIAIKQPLIETFTSSTCGPCNPANATAEVLFLQNPGKVTSIKYQTDFPSSGDPYYTNEVGQRMDYYMPTVNQIPTASVPRMEIDGGWDQNGNNITQQVLDDYIDVLSFVNLSATYSINNKTIDVGIIIDPLENVQSNNLVVHTAIVEETTYNNVKTNGETQFEHVVKKMVPDASGTPITALVGGTQNTLNLQYTFQGNYRLPINAIPSNIINHTTEHSVEDFSNLMVAVWVQDSITKEIHQSTMAILSSVTLISFNCVQNSCIDPGTGSGTFASLSACNTACGVTPTWDCDPSTGACSDPGNGSGAHASLALCNAVCTLATWDCFPNIDPSIWSCLDPENGLGMYSTVVACHTACEATSPSWNCTNSTCIDPGDGSGAYSAEAACEAACETNAINEEVSNLLIYPNPAKNNIYISNLKEGNILVKIYDISGRAVLKNTISNNEYFDVSVLSKGMYQIKLESGDWSTIRKFIKE